MAKNDWYEAGEAIRNLVQDAVENQDFTRLSETISNVVNQAMDGVGDVLEESFGGRYNAQRAAERIRRNMERKRQSVRREIRPANRKFKAPGMITGRLMAWTGYSLSAIFGFTLVMLAVAGDVTGTVAEAAYEVIGVLFALSLWLGIGGGRRFKLAGRARRYVDMLGSRTYCMLEELASGTGKTIAYVRKDLKKMLRKGFFPEGHLDRKEMCLITDNETYQQYLLTQQEADRRSVFGDGGSNYGSRAAADGGDSSGGRAAAGEGEGFGNRAAADGGDVSGGRAAAGGGEGFGNRTAADGGDGSRGRAAADRKDSRASLDRECRELIEEGERYIAHIRECNDRIPGEDISAKLDRLELVVTRIFREVERRPVLAPELRKMMSYYLPTTQKLIDAYCQLDEQRIRGQNIDNTKREIEDALDTINQAFENLLDGFFENTAWDISSDISVLHTMFAQEGLTGKDFPRDGK